MSLYLISCYDNPVVNNEQPFSFDSARFNVTYKQSPYGLDEAYITDTDKIFLGDIYGFSYYKNGEFIYLPFNFNFMSYYIDGFNENNVYLCGLESFSYLRSRYKLIKWNGVDFETIQMDDTVSGSHHEFTSIYCKSPNEMWLGGGDGTAWRYDGTKFHKYFLDTVGISDPGVYSYLLSDPYNNICCVQIRDSSNEIGTSGIRYFKFFKFNNNNEFELTSSKIYINSEGPSIPKRVGNNMYSVTKEGLYNFDGYNFTKIIDIGQIEEPMVDIAGTGPNDLMISGRTNVNNNYKPCLYNWNGKRWSKENKFLSNTMHSTYLTYVNNMYICVDYVWPNSTFIKFLKRN
jgi:hypothetical protein